jgi:hypothetical protein
MNFLCTAVGWTQCSSGANLDSAFADHVSQFGLSYGTKEEYVFRRNIFEEKTIKLDEINSS